MASADARPVPRKNVAYRVTFVIQTANTNDRVTGAPGLDSEISKDGGAFIDCTNEATEIGSSGVYYLDLTATEMNADTVVVTVETSGAGADVTIILYPEEVGDYRTDLDAAGFASALATALAAADDAVLAQLVLVRNKTDNLPLDPADQSLVIAATDAVMARLGAPAGATISADIAGISAGSGPTANENADALLDRADAIDSGYTPRGALRLVAAVLAGKVSGAGTTANTFRSLDDVKDRVVSTVDADGNRSAVTLDGS